MFDISPLENEILNLTGEIIIVNLEHVSPQPYTDTRGRRQMALVWHSVEIPVNGQMDRATYVTSNSFDDRGKGVFCTGMTSREAILAYTDTQGRRHPFPDFKDGRLIVVKPEVLWAFAVLRHRRDVVAPSHGAGGTHLTSISPDHWEETLSGMLLLVRKALYVSIKTPAVMWAEIDRDPVLSDAVLYVASTKMSVGRETVGRAHGAELEEILLVLETHLDTMLQMERSGTDSQPYLRSRV
jgi:hypothetical protein